MFEDVSGDKSSDVDSKKDPKFEIGQIKIVDADFAYYNMDYIATIDPYGSQDKYYTWDPDTSAWYACDSDCNVDFDSPANEVKIEANMGLLFRTENGVSLNIPSPLL